MVEQDNPYGMAVAELAAGKLQLNPHCRSCHCRAAAALLPRTADRDQAASVRLSLLSKRRDHACSELTPDTPGRGTPLQINILGPCTLTNFGGSFVSFCVSFKLMNETDFFANKKMASVALVITQSNTAFQPRIRHGLMH